MAGGRIDGGAGDATLATAPAHTADATPAPGQVPDVTVIVPVTERPDPLGDLHDEIASALGGTGLDAEFVYVLEPWCRALAEPLRDRRAAGAPIRLVQLSHTVGESQLLRLGAARARGRVLLTLPSYRRIEAEHLPGLVERVSEGADLVVAWRSPRRDSWINRLQNRAFHALLGRAGDRSLHDVACGVRAMRPEVMTEVPLYGDFFRFLPVLAAREGFSVVEVPAPQHPADTGTRVYSPGVYLRRLVDLLGLFFLVRFTYKPLRFFGLIGSLLSVLGGGILLVLLIQRLQGIGIADRPMLLLGVLIFVLGIQAVALGLVGEIVVHFSAPTSHPYRVRREDGEERA
jgi:hypothetical protein